jgi:outer membrane protein assembly factor BamB
MLRHLSCLLVTFVVLSASLPAADWPQFRGPTGDGRATAKDLPTEWSETKNVAWKTEISGSGWSSPSLFRNRLYLTTAVPVDSGSANGPLSLRALCVDAATGKVIWNEQIFEEPADAPKIHSKNSHASPTPIVEQGRVYIHFGHQGTACLDLGGRVIWKNDKIMYAPVHGNGGSPVLEGGLLIFSCDGGSDPFVVALDAKTGDERWRFQRETDYPKQFAFSTPTVITVDDRRQLITPGAGVVNALNPATGEEIWHVRYEGYSVIPKPVFGHGLVFLSKGYDSPSVLAIRPDGSGDVTDTHVEWESKPGAPHTPSLLLNGDELYMVSDRGVAVCLDAKTGDQHWQERVGGNYSASPLLADGKLFLQSEDGPAVVLRPGKTFEKLADTGFPERTLASYAVGDSALFIRTEKHLYRVQRGQE